MIFKNYINGEFKDALNGDKLDVFCPSTGKVYAQVVSSCLHTFRSEAFFPIICVDKTRLWKLSADVKHGIGHKRF